jgi:hypothetical protein
MDLLLDFLHEIALALDELLIGDDVDPLRLDVAPDEGVPHLLPLVALEELAPSLGTPLLHHGYYTD